MGHKVSTYLFRCNSPLHDGIVQEVYLPDISLMEICFLCFSGFLHGHVSYLSDDCQACLLLLTVDRDVFFTLSEAKQKIVEVNIRSLTFNFNTQTNNMYVSNLLYFFLV